MKNVAVLNTCSWGSTGKIAIGLYYHLKDKGFNAHFYYGRGELNDDPNQHRIDSKLDVYCHAFLSRLTGLQGSFSKRATNNMLKSFEKIGIDTVFLVSVHGYYLNEKAFFDYVATNNLRLVYTMIDEYAYSGACCNAPVCEKLKTGDGRCPNIKKYPESFFIDNCSSIIKRKIECYQNMRNAVFVGPEFLVESSKKSIIGSSMNTIVLDEAIDVQFYHPCETEDLRVKHNIGPDKIVVLCVAPSTRPHRGAVYFIEAAKKIANDDRFVFIHIGYKFKDQSDLPSNFIPISFVKKDSDLAKYYSLADVMINPSLTDAMSNTCLESLACGTPIVCFNISGMPYLMDETVGRLIPPRDVDAIVDSIINTKKKDKTIQEICRNYALKRYDNRGYADKLIAIAEK